MAYDRRPRGWTVDGAVVPGESTVPGAGRGLFAARALVEGEELGAYPGLVFNAESWAASKGGDTTACAYVWDIGNGLCCDPSDASGSLPDVVRAPWWPFEVKTTLALVNEVRSAGRPALYHLPRTPNPPPSRRWGSWSTRGGTFGQRPQRSCCWS